MMADRGPLNPDASLPAQWLICERPLNEESAATLG